MVCHLSDRNIVRLTMSLPSLWSQEYQPTDEWFVVVRIVGISCDCRFGVLIVTMVAISDDCCFRVMAVMVVVISDDCCFGVEIVRMVGISDCR